MDKSWLPVFFFRNDEIDKVRYFSLQVCVSFVFWFFFSNTLLRKLYNKKTKDYTSSGSIFIFFENAL